ncbi:MAG: HlyD family efflux transporter periplasmic adaptor subunit [Candidatus Viridilinea halotolerans]|uniref:HlyD family efflux transporter periplasmic adaptor subunit n=1 Tax=Candidatus Viridilinea halotolerans TaxID=2491704 RepID=A0A426U0K7_9CHLR|nr:MAG: HlyD family efflux transporter periplasmic adaptor subunit [Candidatus Viridilinea halotolerans]
MASSTTSRKRSRNGRRLLLILGGLLLLGLLIIAAMRAFAPREATPGTLPDGWLQVEASSGNIAANVGATGNIEPLAEANVRFEVSGTVAELLVRPGDQVTTGQPLARIDTGALELRVEQARADLRQAEADLEGLLAGASEAELAEAAARVEQARRQYSQAAASVTPANIAAARADLESAQARLARLQAGPATDDLASAEERVQSARTNLDNARVNLSAAKERARNDVETRANALRNAQDEYSRIYWDNREFERARNEDLPREQINQEVAALRNVTDAETALHDAQTAYDQARQDEINSLQAREAELTSAQAALDQVLRGAETEDVATAQAAVQRAQDTLDQLTGAQRRNELATQQSSITIAQAGLDRLLADPTTSTITAREAAVVRAEVAVRSAQRDVELGTLRAPFAATVARVNMRVGEGADASATVALVDLSSYHVDLPIDELDIAQVHLGQRAAIEVDALPGLLIGGSVTNIAPQATRSDSGTTTYEVTVTLDEDSPGVRAGMTAVVAIIIEEKEDVVLVPRRAVRAEGGQSYVLVPSDTVEANATTPGERRLVELGLSSSEFVEITSGLDVGEAVLVQDVVSTFNPSGGPPR